MSGTKKKTLYRPAPDSMDQSIVSNLVQGRSSTEKLQVKQGVLESSRNMQTNRMTSTMKPVKRSRSSATKNPLVVSHDPKITHSRMRSKTYIVGDVSTDKKDIPKVVVFDAVTGTDGSATKKTGSKVYHVKSKYRATTGAALPANLSLSKKSFETTNKPSSQISINDSALAPRSGQKPQKTSTPTTRHHQDFILNESAISKRNSASSPARFDSGNSYLPSSSEQDNEPLDDIELLHCKYLQAKYLELMALDRKRRTEKETISRLTFLSDKIKEQESEREKLDEEVLELEHLLELKCLVEQFKRNLAPVADKLPSALDRYQELCRNLDTTRHHIHLTDIKVPDHIELEKALDDSRNLIGQINILTNAKAPLIQQRADTMDKLSKACKDEATNIPDIRKNAASVASSTIELGSLVAQLSSYKKLSASV